MPEGEGFTFANLLEGNYPKGMDPRERDLYESGRTNAVWLGDYRRGQSDCRAGHRTLQRVANTFRKAGVAEASVLDSLEGRATLALDVARRKEDTVGVELFTLHLTHVEEQRRRLRRNSQYTARRIFDRSK
jgi:hypothetical protein